MNEDDKKKTIAIIGAGQFAKTVLLAERVYAKKDHTPSEEEKVDLSKLEAFMQTLDDVQKAIFTRHVKQLTKEHTLKAPKQVPQADPSWGKRRLTGKELRRQRRAQERKKNKR